MSWKRKCRVSSRQKRSRLKRLSSTREWRTLALPSSNKTFAAKLRNCWGRALLSLALLLPILLSGAPVVAQRGHRPPSIDDRVKVLAKKLDLNETQQAAVKKILEQRQQETLRLRLDSSITGSVRIERFCPSRRYGGANPRRTQRGTKEEIRSPSTAKNTAGT